MRNLKSTIAFLLSFSLFLPLNGLAQSGRGRPVTPGRETRPAAPPTVTVPEATAVVKQEQAGSLGRFVLKNGITVLINEQHAAPLAAVVAYFKAGAEKETEAATGAASLLARAMLRGTQFRSGEKLAADTRAIGGLLEAQAGFDYTAFSLVAPADKIKEALAIQADLVQNPVLADEEIKKEQSWNAYEAVNTLAATADGHRALEMVSGTPPDDRGATSSSLSRLLRLAFADSRSGRALQGASSLSREPLQEFYREHFHPENLIISVAGAVTTFHTLVEIQRLYGTFKKTEPVVTPAAADKPTADAKAAKPDGKAPVRATAGGGKSGTAPLATGKSKTTPETASRGETQAAPPEKPAAQTQSGAQTPASGAAGVAAAPPAPAVEALRYANERGLTHQSVVSVGFRLQGLGVKERATVEVLAALLGEGRGSRLHRSLFAEQSLVNRVEARALTFADKGIFAVQMWVAPNVAGAIDKAESALFRDLNQLRRELPTAAELKRARLQLENRFFETNSTPLDRATLLARAEAEGGFRALAEYRKRLGEVSAEDVQRAAAKYFRLANTSVYEYEASSAAPRSFDAEKFAQTVTAWSPGFAEAVEAKQVRAADEKSLAAINASGVEKSSDELSVLESIQPLGVKNFSTLNGPQAFVREDHTQPRVTAALLFQGGRLVEDDSNSGITELMLHWMLYGTADRPQTAVQLEQLGGRLEVLVERDYYGFIVDVLAHNANSALSLVRDLVETPAFRDEDFKLARTQHLHQIYLDRDAPMTRARELLAQSLFAGHSYAQPAHGNDAVVARLKEDEVREWHLRTVKRQVPLLVIVGDTEGSALVSSDIATGFRRNDVDASLKARVPPAVKPSEKIEARGFPHTVLALGLPGVKANSDDGAAIAVLKAALNGNGGRLKQELRQRQNLVADVYFDEAASFVGGTFDFLLTTLPEHEARARAALVAEVEQLAKAGLTPAAFASARQVARTATLVRLQSQRERAIEYAREVFYQKQAADVDTLEERLLKVTDAEVKRVAATYFKTAAAAVGIVRGSQAAR